MKTQYNYCRSTSLSQIYLSTAGANQSSICNTLKPICDVLEIEMCEYRITMEGESEYTIELGISDETISITKKKRLINKLEKAKLKLKKTGLLIAMYEDSKLQI
ncbi:MAG: hypothetical protein EOP48_00495 [Sphingobacteriales bacterium]|nr:MAG: hypothetical protein EOP48_00495 [Sphingobacteriales bacterium]